MKPSLTPQENYVVLYSFNIAIECAIMGVISLGLVAVNVICIFVMAYVVLKVN